MKSKYLFQTFVLIAVLLGTIGGIQPAYAQEPDPNIIVRELTYWDATYTGYVDATRFEKWPFVFDGDYEFSVTVTPISGDLVPIVILLDSNGNELTRGTGALTSTQAAGNYFVQIQPEIGSGFYELTIREVAPMQSDVSTSISPESVPVDESAVVSVNLNNIPVDGYTSAEFTCTYPVGVVSINNIVLTELFGTDPATAISDSQDGSFIVAIAGSNNQKALADGVAFTFNVLGLEAGQAEIDCVARASIGDSVLIDLTSTIATLTIQEVILDGILAGVTVASKPITVNLYNLDDTLATTVLANPDGTFSLTAPAGVYTLVAEASGFLKAQGSTTIVTGETTTMPTVSLIAGDIDGNNIIDQFDAMTIGMSYNTVTPDAADLNGDGLINVLDLEIVAANYNVAGPVTW